MRYFVIADDGQKYGPADIPTLTSWAAQGRLLEGTMLEGEMDGQQLPARMVSGIVFPGNTPPMGQPTGEAFANYPRQGYVQESVPTSFNWGAFVFSWIWGLNHRKPILCLMILASCVPFVGPFINFGVSIYVGIKGNQWAWESGRFRTVPDLMACQKVWNTWGIVFFILSILGGISYGVMAAMNPGLFNLR